MSDDDDLFAVRPARRKRIDKPAVEIVRDRIVASFACYCSAQEEVFEPAPAEVDCWRCKRPLGMHRWRPRDAPPTRNARPTTEAERARI